MPGLDGSGVVERLVEWVVPGSDGSRILEKVVLGTDGSGVMERFIE